MDTGTKEEMTSGADRDARPRAGIDDDASHHRQSGGGIEEVGSNETLIEKVFIFIVI